MKNTFVIALVLSLASLSGCSASSGSNGGSSIIPPVQAQSGYSNASLTGTYAFAFGSRADMDVYVGTFNADGNGNITGTLKSKSLTIGQESYCSTSLSGTYSIQSSGAGTMSWTLTPSGTSPCASNDITISDISPQTFALEVAQQGAFIAAGGNLGFTFTAAKQ